MSGAAGVPRVFDCFPFFNELDLLEIRLNELSAVVDRFVLVEARSTFAGAAKPLHFAQNRERFAPFLDRIHHIVLEDLPSAERAGWPRQDRQRDALAAGLAEAGPDDLVLLSDVDEIPRASAVARAAARPADRPEIVCFELRMFNYFINLETDSRWLRSGPRAVRRKFLGRPSALRSVRGPADNPLRDTLRAWRAARAMGRPMHRVVERDAGWHFTYLGGPEAVHEKLVSFLGSERIDPADLDLGALARRIAASRPMIRRRAAQLVARALDDSFPEHLRRNVDRFGHLIAPLPAG
ncbi:hypothetical protein [Prosthecomicrobium pneumaticum]|uniref:Beta-1,4-mannosyl-glycoprotein beta-1,4-N-acetylglucosaminyltransferase n=1 Tax=Prosthecomicrobium pneumaticum TaxID=81895 RepID=A0A7W9L320_9HYPH|nr:hypothetical protein [Prosthecomicrobium pneumaticum]MBB5754071.1 beta-1,4-mannosyl-glycoprotein beta-1,4-N-acetylglucosaminyltransferase [Prosthecomicrobium pneumaticum]